MWDIGGDEWDLFDIVGIFEIVSLSLYELELKTTLFNDIRQKNINLWIFFKCDLFMLLCKY